MVWNFFTGRVHPGTPGYLRHRMEQFVVSARKYRPNTFDTVVGQEQVTSTLKNAIRSGHLAQAFLFTGPRGVGKTTCARILARTINCQDLGEDVVACGKCAPCRDFESGHSMNVYELDAASNNGVDHIRNLIQQVQIAPQVGDRKVYIIDEVHMLSKDAFNAFLKTLEEPPSYAIFILATTEKHKVLPTILSRCQVFDFRRITVGDIAAHLGSIAKAERIEAEPQALHVIAQKADGGLRDALSIFDQLVSFSGHKLTYQDVVNNLNVLDQEHYFAMTDAMLQGDMAACLVGYNNVLQQGFDGHLFVAGLGRHFRDLLVCQDARTLPLLEVSEDLVQRYAQQAAAVPRAMLVKGLERVAEVDTQYKLSKEPRLLVELMLMQLCNWAVADGGTAEKKSPDVNGAGAKPAAATPARPAPPTPSKAPAAPVSPMAATEEPVVPEEVPEPLMASPAGTAAVRRRSAVSIKQYLHRGQENSAEGGVDVAVGVDEDAPEGEKKPVHETLLRQAWQAFALRKKREGRNSLHATLTAREPVVAGPSMVTFPILNEVQERYMRNERPELVGYLRRELGDPALELEVVKEEVKDLKPRYTPQDRFNLMAERNPALLALKQTLGLEVG